MKLNSLICAVLVLFPVAAFCQDGEDLIDDTKERPANAVSNAMSEKERTELRGEISCMGQHLDTFYKDCGRYPTTKEGLRALTSKPKSIVCKKWGVKTEGGSKPYVASLPKNSSGFVYTSANHDYVLRWVGVVSNPGEGNAGISIQDFLKTCVGSVGSTEAVFLRRIIYSSTSFDSGFVNIEIDSEGHAAVDWNYDPFRRPKPKNKPWKKIFTVDETAEKIFNLLDEIGFAKIGNGRDQIPDEPSVSIKEFRAGKLFHSVTYPAKEVPKDLQKLDPLLKVVYEDAKKH
jgi:hypothetical protein